MTCPAPQNNVLERRRTFWTTKPVGSVESCGNFCADPALSLIEEPTYSTIDNTDWIRGYILNVLFTTGRVESSTCGTRASAVGGHWSSSFIEDGPSDVGTQLDHLPNDLSVNATLNLVVAYVQTAMNRMVQRGLATRVDVNGAYAGLNKFNVDVVVYGYGANETRVALAGDRLENGWAWA